MAFATRVVSRVADVLAALVFEPLEAGGARAAVSRSIISLAQTGPVAAFVISVI